MLEKTREEGHRVILYRRYIDDIIALIELRENPCIAQPMRWRSTLIECMNKFQVVTFLY